MQISSNRPYLIRALYQWLVDNGLTPHLLVEVEQEDVVIPRQYIEDGRIVLNISPSAVQRLDLGNQMISFNARFGGKPMDVLIPPAAVLGIYARENGRGMLFPDDDSSRPDDSPPNGSAGPPPSLKVVK